MRALSFHPSRWHRTRPYLDAVNEEAWRPGIDRAEDRIDAAMRVIERSATTPLDAERLAAETSMCLNFLMWGMQGQETLSCTGAREGERSEYDVPNRCRFIAFETPIQIEGGRWSFDGVYVMNDEVGTVLTAVTRTSEERLDAPWDELPDPFFTVEVQNEGRTRVSRQAVEDAVNGVPFWGSGQTALNWVGGYDGVTAAGGNSKWVRRAAVTAFHAALEAGGKRGERRWPEDAPARLTRTEAGEEWCAAVARADLADGGFFPYSDTEVVVAETQATTAPHMTHLLQ